MRSVRVTNPFAWPQVRRGSETLALGLAGWLRSQHVDARIVAGGPAPRRYSVEGVPVELVPAPDLRRFHHDLDPQLTLVPAMAAHLRKRPPDIVHALLYGDALAARAARVPYVVMYGGMALRRGFESHRVRWHAFLAATRGARAVVSPSSAAADHLAREFGFRSIVIPNAIDCASYVATTSTEPRRILCAATPDDSRKRVHVLVDAFALLARRGRDATLVLAGRSSSSTRAHLLSRLPAELRHRVKWLGDLDRRALVAEYGRAAVTCLPSVKEAFGLVLIESLAAGTPVVGAHDGAIPEIVTPDVGMTFESDDAAACARALESVFEQSTDKATADACRRRALDFDWSRVGPRWLDLYQEVGPR